MKCKKCGAEIKDGNIYCSVCGAEVQIVPDYSILENDLVDSYIGSRADTSLANQGKKKEKAKPLAKRILCYLKAHKKKSKALLATVGVFFLLLVLGLFRIVYLEKKNMNSYQYQFEKGVEAFEADNFRLAATYFKQAYELQEGDVESLLYLAKSNYYREEFGLAESEFLAVIQLDPANKDAYEGLILLYVTEKKYKKIADLKDSVVDEDILSLFEDFEVDAPKFSLRSGSYDDDLTISISAGEGDTIYYSMDGRDPYQYGDVYQKSILLNKEGEYELQAIAVDKNGFKSEIKMVRYTIHYKVPETPVVSLASGSYSGDQLVTINVPEDCIAYYTWDGSAPTRRSATYTEALHLPIGESVLSVIYISSHGIESDVASFHYECVN